MQAPERRSRTLFMNNPGKKAPCTIRATDIDWTQSRHTVTRLFKSRGRRDTFPLFLFCSAWTWRSVRSASKVSAHTRWNPDAADAIAMGTGPLTTISDPREEKRAISLSLYSLSLRFSHILVLSRLSFLWLSLFLWFFFLFYMPFHFRRQISFSFIK